MYTSPDGISRVYKIPKEIKLQCPECGATWLIDYTEDLPYCCSVEPIVIDNDF